MTQSAKRAFQVGDKVRWFGSGGWEVVLAVTSAHAFLVDASVGTAAVFRVPLSELTLVESAPSEPGKSTDLLYGWERCSHEGIGKPGCSTCDPDKSRCVAKLERDLAQRDATIAELVAERDEARKDYAAEKVRTLAAKMTADTHTKTLMGIHDALHRECSGGDAMLADEIRALRAKSEQRREALKVCQSWMEDEGYRVPNDREVDGPYEVERIARTALSDDAPPKAEAAPAMVAAVRAGDGRVLGVYPVPAEADISEADLAAQRAALENERLKAEVERLKAEAQLKADCDPLPERLGVTHFVKYVSRADRLEAENAKLRDALQAAVDALEGWWCDATGNRRHSDDARALQMAAALGVKVTS